MRNIWRICGTAGKLRSSGLSITIDTNGNMLTQPSISNTGTGMVYTLYWDAMRRIREKTWTADSTDYHQVFYHDGRTLVQIWNQDDADPNDVTRSIGYDLYRGSTGYLKDIDFEDDPDVESYLIKDDHG